jgi:DNA invertase Pin-like site-specific DNA recombinase
MQTAIGYLRVSTREQGRSGLGLAAQRHEIEAFGEREGFAVKSWQQYTIRGLQVSTTIYRQSWQLVQSVVRSGVQTYRNAQCALSQP